MIQIRSTAELGKSLSVKREKDGDDVIVACHLWHSDFKRFTHATWLAMPLDVFRRDIEAMHVRHYAPPFNRTSHG